MASAKELIDEAADRLLIPRESSYVGAATPAARQYVSLLKFVTAELLKRGNWQQLKRVYAFLTQTNVSNYQLPGDWWRPLLDTNFSVTKQTPLSGPISNAESALRTYGMTQTGPYSSFMVSGPQGYTVSTSPYTATSAGYFVTDAGINNTDQNVIAYISRNAFWPKNWVTITAYVVGDKVTGVANTYICTTAGTSGATRPSVLTGTVVDGTVTWTVYTEYYPISADTDICLLDDELVIEGIRWAYWRSKKQDYGQEKADWEDSVKFALGRKNGAIRVNAAGSSDFDFPITKDGSWSVS